MERRPRLRATTAQRYESSMRDAPRRPKATSHALHVAVIVLLVTVAYAGSFGGEWVSDDTVSIAQNPLLRSLAPANLPRLLTAFDGPNYMPLKMLSLAVDYQLFGANPTGYHVVNLLLHIANALLVYLLLLRLGEPAVAAFAVALLWGVHPVHVESVAWISERKNVLSTLFFLLAFLAYLRFSDRPRARTYVLMFVLFVCALLTKINTIVLPAIAIAYEVAWRFRLRAGDVVAMLPLLAAGALLAWVNLHGNPSHGAAYHGGSLWVTLRTSSTVVPRYVGLILLPVGLQSYYPVPLHASWLDPAVLASTLAIVACGVTAIVLVWRRRRAAFWMVWFLVTLAPMLNLVPFPALMADRYLYIPLVGALALLAWAAQEVVRRAPRVARALPIVVGGAIAACMLLTLARVPVFHDDFRLWADWALTTSYISSDHPYAAASRARELQVLRDAIARDGTSGPLHNNVGAIAFEEGRMADAVDELSRAYALAPHDPAIALNLGRAYLFARQPEAAARTLEEAVRLEPPSYYAHLNLARAYVLLGDAARARAAVADARAIKPTWVDLPAVEAAVARLEQQNRAHAAGS